MTTLVVSVASAGDVNSDGYSDVIVGALLNDAGGTDAGRAYIYFGGASMNNVVDVTLTGAAWQVTSSALLLPRRVMSMAMGTAT